MSDATLYTIDGALSDDPSDEYTADQLRDIHRAQHETKGEQGWDVCAWDGEPYPCTTLRHLEEGTPA